MQSRVEECERLKDKLEILENQDDEDKSKPDEKEIFDTKNRISACETEIASLKEKIEELKCIIQDESMYATRGRNLIRSRTQRLFDQVVEQSQREIKRKGEEFEEILRNKEAEHYKALTEQEAATQKKLARS